MKKPPRKSRAWVAPRCGGYQATSDRPAPDEVPPGPGSILGLERPTNLPSLRSQAVNPDTHQGMHPMTEPLGPWHHAKTKLLHRFDALLGWVLTVMFTKRSK